MPIAVTVLGIIISVRDVQPSNADAFINSKLSDGNSLTVHSLTVPSSNLSILKELHPLNADKSIVSKRDLLPFINVILVIPLHPSNAPAPIVTRFSEIVNSVIAVIFLNASVSTTRIGILFKAALIVTVVSVVNFLVPTPVTL